MEDYVAWWDHFVAGMDENLPQLLNSVSWSVGRSVGYSAIQ